MRHNFRIGDRRDIDDFGDPDDLTIVSDFVSQIREDDNGFPIMSFTVGLPGKKQYKGIVYINNKIHNGNHTGRQTITNAELAAMFFFGKWSGWFDSTILPALRGIQSSVQYRIEQQATTQAKDLRKEYNAAIRRWKKTAAFGRVLAAIANRAGVGPIINTFDENNNPISMPFVEFAKATRLHTQSRGWTPQMEVELAGAKREAWINEVLPRVRSVEETDPLLAQLIWDPYKYGAFIKGVVQAGAREMADKVTSLIAGSKAPDISPKTKANRRSRGMSDSPPLFETGDFADSVEYAII